MSGRKNSENCIQHVFVSIVIQMLYIYHHQWYLLYDILLNLSLVADNIHVIPIEIGYFAYMSI